MGRKKTVSFGSAGMDDFTKLAIRRSANAIGRGILKI
jgi:hypothetical protein